MDDPSPDGPVCLLSPHPLALKQLHHTMSALGSRIETGRIDFKLVPRDLALNGAGVYVVDVVDAAASRPAIDALIGAILSEAPHARIIVLAEDFSEDEGCALLGLGVKGLVRYADIPGQLSRALSAVAGGGFWAPRSLVSCFIESRIGALRARHLTANASLVSKRENEVLDAIVENLSNKEIAGRLNISERTVKFHVSNLLAKFGVGRRSDLILLLAHRTQVPVH